MAVIGINYTGANYDYDSDDNRIENPGGLKYESVYVHSVKSQYKEIYHK